MDTGPLLFPDAVALAPSAGGGAYAVAVGYDDQASQYAGFLFRLDAQGAVQWKVPLGNDFFSARLAADDGASVYVMFQGQSSAVVQRRNASDGSLAGQWAAPEEWFEITGLAAGLSGSKRDVYVAARSFPPEGGIAAVRAALDPLTMLAEKADSTPADLSSGVDADGQGFAYAGWSDFTAKEYRLARYGAGLQPKAWESARAADMGAFESAILQGRADPRGGYVFLVTETADAGGDNGLPLLRRVDASGNFQGSVSLPAGLSEVDLDAVDGAGNAYLRWFDQSFAESLVKAAAGGLAWGPWTPEHALSVEAVRPSGNRLYVSGEGWDGQDAAFVAWYQEGASGGAALAKAAGTAEPVVGVTGGRSAPLAVQAADGGQPAATAVSFAVLPATGSAGASVSPAAAQTDPATGKASTILTFGDVPAEYRVTAACPNCDPAQSSVTFQCCGKLGTTDYKQSALPWGPKTYDSIGDNIGTWGCALTSLTNLNNYYAQMDAILSTASVKLSTQTPDTLNTALIALGADGFAPHGRIVWGGINYVTNRKISASGLYRINAPYPLDSLISLVTSNIQEKHPVIIGISQENFDSHYMLVAGTCGNKFIVYDPSLHDRVLYDPRDLNDLLVAVVSFIYTSNP